MVKQNLPDTVRETMGRKVLSYGTEQAYLIGTHLESGSPVILIPKQGAKCRLPDTPPIA